MENGLTLMATLPLTLYTYTIPTMILMTIVCLGRIIYQVGYAKRGFGGHILGFMIDRLATGALNGFLLLAAFKAF